MLKNYLKVAFRNLMRQNLYSVINILGLSIGIACFLLISLWVYDEITYDQFHQNKQRLYRVNTNTNEYGLVTSSSWRLGPALKATYPEVEEYTRIWPWERSLVEYNKKRFDESEFYLADPSFFTMFTFSFLYGSPQNALADKYSIVLTAETAQRYFGDKNPIGKSVFVRNYEHDFQVTGVIENIPANSSLQFDLIARVDLMPQQRLESWEFTGYTYVLLQNDVNKESAELKIHDFYRDFVDPDTDASPLLQPITDIHLYQYGTPGLVKQVRYFSVIAIFILLIACINFMSLSTARATKRALEIGVRKVVGALRRQIILQFFSESILISMISMVIGILLVELLLPVFNQITGKELAIFSDQTEQSLIFIIVITFLSGIVAGSYPAVYLSAFRPVQVLKNKSNVSEYGKSFRRILTIVQFSISIGLIISAFIVQQQLTYIQNKDIGMKRDHIVNLIANQDLVNKFDAYRDELIKNPSILSVTSAASTPFNIGTFINVNWEGHFDKEEVGMPYTMVEYDFFKTFGMTIIQGRAFSRKISTDATEACIINQSAARLMGFDSPIGKEVYFDHPAFDESYKRVRIIGVVNDFHVHSLHEKVVPSIFRMYAPYQSYVYIKTVHDDHASILQYIKTITQNFAPDFPFRYEYLNQTYNRLYRTEDIMGKLINVFTLLAVFISCLGLFGLASYTIEKRTKEIGIRKVLGASVSKITSMLSIEFLKWVIIANFVAWPVAWFIMNQWLENFVYHIDFNWWVFIGAGLTALLIALLTVSGYVIKAAMSNPVKSLRYE